jgi:NADH-quinone oxidoreductase subunit I
VPGETAESIERIPEVFDIDLSRCMFCGLCEEACPEEAIVMSRTVELAGLDRDSMLFSMQELLHTPEQLGRRIDTIQRDYERR